MTINDYLQNPYGKGAAFSSTNIQKEKLETEYDQNSDKFLCRIYRHRDTVIYHIIVPSMNKSYISYDVVLEIKYNIKQTDTLDVGNLEFKCFSNCPSFIFTYANAFRQKNLICKWLDNKYRVEVKKKEAVIKNQYGIIGLERSLYLACLHLKKYGLIKQEVIATTAKKVNAYSEIAKGVRNQDEIMEKSKLKLDKKEEKELSGVKDISFRSKNKDSTRKGMSGYTRNTNSTLFTSAVSAKSKKISKTKSIRKI